VTQLLECAQAEQKLLAIPDSQKVRVSQLTQPVPPHINLGFALNSKKQHLISAIEELRAAALKISESLLENRLFCDTFSKDYRKHLWILQGRYTPLGTDFFLDYGLKKGSFLASLILF